MEKKKYNKPEVTTAKVDCNIIILNQSAVVTQPDAPTQAPNEVPFGTFINPFKWFR
jgi:hypothetical protein